MKNKIQEQVLKELEDQGYTAQFPFSYVNKAISRTIELQKADFRKILDNIVKNQSKVLKKMPVNEENYQIEFALGTIMSMMQEIVDREIAKLGEDKEKNKNGV